eukprot:15333453-Ditylum_brightwellii.AAC.1
MYRSFHFEATPMAPPGTKYYIHIKPHKCTSLGFHAEDAWYVGPALNQYRCYTVVTKERVAQRITNTFKFKHHGIKVPNVTPAEQIAKAVKDLTAAVRNDPTKGPLVYIKAVQRLRAVLLNEKQQECPVPGPHEEKKEVPLRNPNHITEQPIALRVPMPTNEIPTQHQALILCKPDEIDMTAVDEPPIIPIQPMQRYNLRECAMYIINSLILEESPNIKSSTTTPHYIGRYTAALKHLMVTEAFNLELYSPTIMFADAVIDPETRQKLEYRDLIKKEKYKAVWIRTFMKRVEQLAQGKCGCKGTNATFFIRKEDIPADRTATYGSIVVDYRPRKADPNRVHLDVGGDHME